MKKFFGILLFVFLFGACATPSLENRVAMLEERVASVEMLGASGVGASFYPARALSGGGAGALDTITGVMAKDVGFVVLESDATYGNALLVYVAVDEAVEEAPPFVIDPDEAGTIRWRLVNMFSNTAVGGVAQGANITGAATIGDAAGEVNKAYMVTAACTVTLSDVGSAYVPYGSILLFYVKDAAEQVIIDVDAGDIINLHGTPLAAGNTIDSPLNAGDFICLIASTDVNGSGGDGWITLGFGEEVWTDGGAT